MKTFLHSVKQTFTSQQVYQNAIHKSGWSGIKLVLKTVLALGLILGVVWGVIFLVSAPYLKGTISSYVQTHYPDDLVVTIDKGILSTNTTNPVVFPVPGERKNHPDSTVEYRNLLTIVPSENNTSNILTKYDSLIVATADNFIIKTNYQTRMSSYDGMDTVVTKESLTRTVDTIVRIGSIGIIVLIIPIALFFVLVQLGLHLMWLVIVAAFIWIAFRIQKQNYTYKQVYKASIYALVPLLILESVLVPLGIAGRLFTLVFVSVVVFVGLRKSVVEKTTELE